MAVDSLEVPEEALLLCQVKNHGVEAEVEELVEALGP
jgi:hypothetical protein